MTINDANSVYRQTKIFSCYKFTIISIHKKKTKKTMKNIFIIFYLLMKILST